MKRNVDNRPLVSVFIPYYNDEKFLKQAIDAVLNSTYQNFELILLNHATLDGCRELAHSYKDKRIKHIDMSYNLGYGGGGLLMEKFLQKASGKYLKFLCADDVIRQDGLENLVNYMENNPQVDFAFGNVEYVDEKGKDLDNNFFNKCKWFSLQNNEVDCLRLFTRSISFLPYVGSIVKSSKLSGVKLRKNYVMTFDMSLWAALLVKECKIGYCDKIVANYRIHDEQICSVSKKNLINRLSCYEKCMFWKIFLQIDNVDLVKKIWPDGRFVAQLKNKGDIPFVVAYEIFKQHEDEIKLSAMSYIGELLDDEKSADRIQKEFGYGISQIRKDWAGNMSEKNFETKNKSAFKKFKQRIYNKNPRDLNVL